MKLRATGINRVQLALDPIRLASDVWGGIADSLRHHGFTIVSGMFGCLGEDYSTLHNIQVTGGIVPDNTWEDNWRNAGVIAAIAQKLGLRLVTFHAGFLPECRQDKRYSTLATRLTFLANVFQKHGIVLCLETGQERAIDLAGFLRNLNHPNLGVNFDPANMILYDKGDPIESLRLLSPWVRQVHIKDAIRTSIPGNWGDEVVVGSGQVNWQTFFETLVEIGFQGDCCLEREGGRQRAKDIRTAHEFLRAIQVRDQTASCL